MALDVASVHEIHTHLFGTMKVKKRPIFFPSLSHVRAHN